MTVGRDDIGEVSSSSCGIKVHRLMCKELTRIVDRVAQILPALESAQPRCTSGIDALCSLNSALEKAKLLIQHCTESSKLYLVITGDVIKLRCERVQSSFVQSLSQIQSMVPVLLAAQVSTLVVDLKNVKFIMEPSEVEAGKIILDLLRQASNSTEDSEFENFQIAVLRLQLTSSKAVLIEKRSIKKLLDKILDTDHAKERILKYLLYLLRKHGHSIQGLQTANSIDKGDVPDTRTISLHDSAACDQSIKPERDAGSVVYEMETNVSCKPMPPDEFKCPISLRLMHDPVIIASGKTFERVWIEKWFKEGHDTCPSTQTKLPHLSVIPNSSMKDLISKWCRKHGLSIPDPSSQPIPSELDQRATSSSSSIASFSDSFNNVPLRLDDSSVSLGSPDLNDSSVSLGSPDLSSVAPQEAIDSFVSQQTDNDYDRYQSFFPGMDSTSLSKLCELSWESQCRFMEKVRNHLDNNKEACHSILCNTFVQALVRFFKDACDRSDVKAQRIGAVLLQIFVTESREEVPSFYEDLYYLLVSFLDSEISEEALAIIEVLSGDECCKFDVVASGALPAIVKIIESQNSKLQISAARTLRNLSAQSNIAAQIIHKGYIPKLISLLGNKSLALHCICILKNLCLTVEGRLAICEANTFIASIVELLETGTCEEQEHAVGVLFSLCSHCVEYCQVVLEEGVIPPLVTISINGNTEGKEIANDLLRMLRERSTDIQTPLPPTESLAESPCEPIQCSTGRQPVSKAPGYFKRKIRFFSKPRSVALY